MRKVKVGIQPPEPEQWQKECIFHNFYNTRRKVLGCARCKFIVCPTDKGGEHIRA